MEDEWELELRVQTPGRQGVRNLPPPGLKGSQRYWAELSAVSEEMLAEEGPKTFPPCSLAQKWSPSPARKKLN